MYICHAIVTVKNIYAKKNLYKKQNCMKLRSFKGSKRGTLALTEIVVVDIGDREKILSVGWCYWLAKWLMCCHLGSLQRNQWACLTL